MRSFEITEVKKFMAALLTDTVYDNFLVTDLKMIGAAGWIFDGRRNKEFYDDDEFSALPEKDYVLWSEIRGIVFNMIKGSKQPLSLTITFKLNTKNTERTVADCGTRIPQENVGGIFLNIRYDREKPSQTEQTQKNTNGSLQVTTGTSLKSFYMDRSLDNAWDEYAERFLKKNGLL